MIYRAHFVLPITEDPIEGGEVLVRGGKIEAVGSDIASSLPDEPVDDLGHRAILPGFVNAHTHLDYTILRGMLDDLHFFPWIRKVTELGSKLSYEDFLTSARLGALALVKSGVTAIGDSSFSGASLEAAAEAGLRGTVYQETFGPDPSADYHDQIESLATQIGELSGKAGNRLTVGISPHSVYTASEQLLRLVLDLALDESLPIALHVAETQAEVDFIRSAAGPIAEFYKWFGYDIPARGVSPVAYLHDIGILGPKTMAAHCIHVTDADISVLAEEETRVAHCPKSNAKLGVGTCPLDEIVDRGIVAGIGTDSALSSNSLDMFEEMRFAVLMQRAHRMNVDAMNARRILELATLGGATALGLEAEIGSLEAGKRADLIAVDLSGTSAFPSPDPYSAIVYSCSAADVVLTLIDGEEVYREGRFSRMDEKETLVRSALLAAKLR